MSQHANSPRQKMIGVMYLVLTALLALNVSKETLKAFIVVNENVEQNNDLFLQKIQSTYKTFEQDYNINTNEVASYWLKAQKARSISQKMTEYVNYLKYDLISKIEEISIDSAMSIDLTAIEKKDDYTFPTNYFIGNSEDGSAGRAIELKEKIIKFKQEMLELLDPKYHHKIRLGLETDGVYYNADKEIENWEMHNFYYSILVADIVILNNIITEIYNTEFDIVKTLYETIRAEDFHYDNVNARVISESNYIFTGDSYKAEIVVAAFDTSQNPEAYFKMGIDSLKISQIEQASKLECTQGKIYVDFPALAEGTHKYAGIVRVKNKNGEINNYHFSDEYIVASPSLTVSATKMNVLYIGVENSVSISVPGIPTENLLPKISFGTLKQSSWNNDWIAEVLPGYRQVTISVSALINGVYKEMGVQRFRVKKLPNPTALVANKNKGFIDKELLIAAGGVIAKMPDDFEYDLSFKIVSFIMTIQRGFNVHHFKATNEKFTEEMIKQIMTSNRGQNILFEDIIAQDPVGDKRHLAPIILSIN